MVLAKEKVVPIACSTGTFWMMGATATKLYKLLFIIYLFYEFLSIEGPIVCIIGLYDGAAVQLVALAVLFGLNSFSSSKTNLEFNFNMTRCVIIK
jgi:hypothetical protein